MSDEAKPMNTRLMRDASYLLPDPGGEVVRQCLDEIERLRSVAGPFLARSASIATRKHSPQTPWLNPPRCSTCILGPIVAPTKHARGDENGGAFQAPTILILFI